ncbi:MAG: type sorting protein [Bacteroidetes bacterium]|nr:type sorting protein [Bacteroidota bacterium]
MKKLLLLIGALSLCNTASAQVLFSNSAGNLTLQTYPAGSGVVQYTTVPSPFSLINDAYNAFVGPANNPNSPFHIAALNNSPWAVKYNAQENDTFFVSTSWLDITGTNVDRWLISPPVSSITANSVLTWLAKSPDALFPDGYEVYGTNKTGTLTAGDFTPGDKLFSIPDGNTSEGGEKSTWTRRSVPLGAFAGQTLRFAFRNNSKDMYQLWIDDIEVKTLPFLTDGSCTSIETEKYILTNTSHTINVNYSNAGAATINSVTLNYQYGTSGISSQTFSFTNGLSHLQEAKLTFGLPYSVSQAGYYLVKVWPGVTNGISDGNQSNDTTKFYVTAQTTSPKKNVLVEQFVSANDPESTDAQQKILAFQHVSPLQQDSIVVVNIHDNDSLKEANSTGVLSDYKKEFSTAMIDRVYYSDLKTNAISRSYYTSKINQRCLAVTPASVNIINKNYNSGTKNLSFTVKADFVGEVKGDYRINAYLIENNVHGKSSDTTINGYNQLNAYYNVPWSNAYQLGYFSSLVNTWVTNAWEYKHQRVLIHSFDGSFGNPGTIPQTGGTAGQSYQATFTTSIPTSTNGAGKYNADNIYIVAFVAEYSSDKYKRDVLNVTMDKVTSANEVLSIKESKQDAKFSVFPNPSTGHFYIRSSSDLSNYRISVFDVLGKCVMMKRVVNSYAIEKLDLSELSNGAYLINIETGTGIHREKVIISKN